MISSTAVYFYLHGFASSPRSAKAQYLDQCFRSVGIQLTIPDLNQEDFYHLSLSRQIRQVEGLMPSDKPVTLIGSSFGGLTAAWLGEKNVQVDRLILLAPAFQFLAHWIPKLGPEQMQRWQTEQSLMTYHHGEARMLPIHYDFVTDLAPYDETHLQRPLPTLILHGQADEVIPIQASRNFAEQRSWVTLIELESDHSLGNVQLQIWQAIQAFLEGSF
ncbi:esterase [filamentous cyanobacterium CCP1]|nr:esterase [filamentous cyanobacterium CCP2]PSB59980.1 esterase [filamentous cyanobacterium CCP1]